MTELFGHYADAPSHQTPARSKAKHGRTSIDPGIDHGTGAFGPEDAQPMHVKSPGAQNKAKHGGTNIDPGLDHRTGAFGPEDAKQSPAKRAIPRRRCRIVKHERETGAVRILIDATPDRPFFNTEAWMLSDDGTRVASFVVEGMDGLYGIARVRGILHEKAKEYTWADVPIFVKEAGDAVANGPGGRHSHAT